jgi:hypothetical protein
MAVKGGGAIKPIDVHPMRNQFESDRRSVGASGDRSVNSFVNRY